jgi:hypothetical protein
MPPYQGNVEEVTHPLDLLEFFEFYDGDSHQTAAINELERAIRELDPDLLESSAGWYKTWTWCVGGKRKR